MISASQVTRWSVHNMEPARTTQMLYFLSDRVKKTWLMPSFFNVQYSIPTRQHPYTLSLYLHSLNLIFDNKFHISSHRPVHKQ